MRKINKLILITGLSLLTSVLTMRAKTVIFNDTFGYSTLNSTTPANPDTNSTAYQMLSAKSWSGESISTNLLRIGMVGTSSGTMECQALFTTNPVALTTNNDAIELRVTFTNTDGLLSAANGQLSFGLYNSGGIRGAAQPVPGGLQGTLKNSYSGASTGNAQGWQGYMGQLFYDGGSDLILNRDAQTGSDNDNQSVITTGTSSSFGNPGPASISAGAASTLTLTTGAVYTDVLRITKDGDNSLAITNTLYSGPEAGGIQLATFGGVATNSTYLTGNFDALAIGWRATGGSATTMDVSKISVTKLTQADLPALYNLQLNGFTNSTFSGAAQIGNTNDLWNNPDWTGVYTGSTNLFSDVSILTSGGANRGVTATLTAAYNNNSGGWNTGVFDQYSGKTSGDATPILMDQEVKVDYSQAVGAVNVMTLTFSGLPTNKLATVYVYGAGDGAGQGGLWSLGAANGGTSAVIGYDGSATGRNVALASSKGISWDSLSGMTDASGKLTVTATGSHNNQVWWQTYMNGIQVQIGGTAPTILGLKDQTVEDGTTVNLDPVVTGNPAPTYQWYENGTNMPGETTSTLTLTNVTTSMSGNIYSLVAENAIGMASNSMTLTVNASIYSTMSVTSVSPANGSTGICYDTPLVVTFSDSVSLGSMGAIKIFNTTNSTTPVDTIYAADGLVQQRHFPGDGQSFSYPTISISNNTVTILPHFDVLSSNQTYYVTIDPKTFLDSGGTNFIGLTDTNAWRFTTKPVAPLDPNNIVVNRDGSGDFLTVQGAVNSVPNGNTTPRIINVHDGLYHEIVDISGKNNLTLRGQSRTGTVIGFENNATYQTANGGTTHARMAFKVNANDITLDDMTISNMTPQGGSQAEALMIETGAKHCIVNNCDIDSRQDTILANVNSSQGYFYNSTIAGNYDYIWGGGNLFFQKCNFQTLSGSGGYNLTAARTDTSTSKSASTSWINPNGTTYSANGFSFFNCTFSADSGVANVTLAGNNGTSGGLDSWVNCKFDVSAYITPTVTLSNNYVLWQNQNTTLDGSTPVSFANVQTIGVTNNDPRLLAATNVTTWFYGWTPQQGPDIVSQPVSRTVPAGQSVSFTVGATGFPSPSYQWTKDGTNLIGQTGATLTIPSANGLDIGTYAVVVSNGSGHVTSGNATLTVLAPTMPAAIVAPQMTGKGSVEFTVSGPAGSAGFSYRIWATTNLMLAPITSKWNLVTNGIFGSGPVVIKDPKAADLPQRFYIISMP